MYSEQQLTAALVSVNERRLANEVAAFAHCEVPSIPARQERRIQKKLADLDRQYQNGTLFRQQSVSRRKVKRALLVAAIVILLLLAAVFATAIIQRQMQTDNGFVEIVFPKSAGKDRLDASFGEIPDGFELVEKNKEKAICRYVFQHGKDRLVIISRKGSSAVVFDMDSLLPEKTNVNGHPAYYCISDDAINLAWSTGRITRRIFVDLSSGLTIEDLVKIAQSFED